MIKVLHFVSNISTTNGMMKVIMNYYRNLETNSTQFGFLYFDERKDTYSKEIESLGGEIFKVPRPNDIIKFRSSLDYIAVKINEQYDILHVHEFFMAVFLKGFQKKASIKKMVIHAHVTRFSNGNYISSMRNWLLSRGNFLIADFYMASSEKAGYSIFGKLFNKKGVVINNAISIREFYPKLDLREDVRNKYGIKDDYVIGHVGNMYPPKNHTFIIDVFYELIKIKDNSKLLLVGDGVLKNDLEKKCQELGLADKVIFTGKSSEIGILMQAMDVFIFPSVFEGLGIAMIEAQTAGLPCIYSDVIPREADIVEDQNIALNLNDPIDDWVKCVLSAKKSVPYPQIEGMINAAGYNIELEAIHLKNEYEKILAI